MSLSTHRIEEIFSVVKNIDDTSEDLDEEEF
jgi:hypothetical protein